MTLTFHAITSQKIKTPPSDNNDGGATQPQTKAEMLSYKLQLHRAMKLRYSMP
jgi:hypothetical protein